MTNRFLQIGGDTFPRDPDGIYEGEFENEEVLKKKNSMGRLLVLEVYNYKILRSGFAKLLL